MKNTQKPFSNNNIEQQKTALPTTFTELSGWIANSINGGHTKPIFYKQVMAGEKHKEMMMELHLKTLTPKSVSFQGLKATIRTFFVPNSRIWTNAEKFTSQRGGDTEVKIEEIPNLGGQSYEWVGIPGTSPKFISIQNTTTWRDSFVSTYIPRVGALRELSGAIPNKKLPMPKISILPLRGFVAIYNDFLRSKQYSEPIQEFKTDTVSSVEMDNYIPNKVGLRPPEEGHIFDINWYTQRCRRDDSYWTDYRLDLQGFDTEGTTDILENPGTALLKWQQWESLISETRQQSENTNKTDWQIISEIRGSKLLTEGKVQLIGKYTFPLNYNSITQTSYNSAEDIQPEYQIMGTQGGYSYTNIKIPLYAGMEFNEEGYVHVLISITADSLFETSVDALEKAVRWDEQYRPGLSADKLGVLYKCELGTEYVELEEDYEEILGYKRKYNEYFKLNNILKGDLATNDYYGYVSGLNTYTESLVITQKSYQFFEPNPEGFFSNDGTFYAKKIWLDYTDIAMNENQAIKNEIVKYQDNNFFINGKNQIYLMGKTLCLAELPIDGSIRTNKTSFTEH